MVRFFESRVLTHPMFMGVLAVLLWSTIAVGFKLGLREMQPLQLLWIGSCCSWSLFTVCIALLPSQPFTRPNVTKALFLGLLNPFLYYLILLTAYDLLPAHVAQPLNYTWAIVTAIFAIPFLRQSLSTTTLVGTSIGYAGVLVLVTKARFASVPDFDLMGVGLALLSTLVWAAYWIWSVSVALKPWWFMWFGFSLAVPLLTVLCIFTTGLPEITWSNIGYGLWIGWLEMGFAFLLWQRAMATTNSVAKLSQLIFLSPLISLGLIYTVLGEPIHPTALVGVAMILFGLYVVNRRGRSLSRSATGR